MKLLSKQHLDAWTRKVGGLRRKGVKIHKGKRGGFFHMSKGHKIYI